MYMYPIKINHEKQKIQTNHEVKLLKDRAYNIEQIKELVGNNSFFIDTYDNEIILSFNKYRYETDIEQQKRIESEENYMKEYNKRNLK